MELDFYLPKVFHASLMTHARNAEPNTACPYAVRWESAQVAHALPHPSPLPAQNKGHLMGLQKI